MTQPAGRLADRTVVVTRAEEDAGPLAERLEALGARVVRAPCLAVRPVTPSGPVADEALVRWPKTAWVVFSSRHGVRGFAAWLDQQRVQLPARMLLGAVGPGTAAEVERIALRRADVTPEVCTGEGLSEALLAVARPEDGDVLLPAAAKGRRVVEQRLVDAGFRARPLVVYETVPATAAEGPLPLPADVDCVVFTSPSTVEGFIARAALPRGVSVVSMGPTTSRALRERGLPVTAEATRQTLDGLIEVIP